MRKTLLHWMLRKTKEGEILPVWGLLAHAVLFPLVTFYWSMNKSQGYDWQHDIWTINGHKFTGIGLQKLAESQGKVYKISSEGDAITLTRIYGVTPPNAEDVTEEMLDVVRKLPNSMRNERNIYSTIVKSWMESSQKP